jgi:hypothetical protein
LFYSCIPVTALADNALAAFLYIYTPVFGVITEYFQSHTTHVHVLYYVLEACFIIRLANHIFQARAMGGDASSMTSGF